MGDEHSRSLEGRNVRRIASFFFLATLFACTFEKVHWNFGGQLALADVLALCFIVAYVWLSRPRVPRTSAILLGFGLAFVVVYLCGFYNLDTAAGFGQFSKGLAKFVIHFTFLALAVAWLSRAGRRLLLALARLVLRRHDGERGLRRPPARLGAGRGEPRQPLHLPAHGRSEPDQHLRRGQRLRGLSAECAHRRSESSRDHVDRPAPRAHAALSAAGAGAPPAPQARRAPHLPDRRRDRDPLA